MKKTLKPTSSSTPETPATLTLGRFPLTHADLRNAISRLKPAMIARAVIPTMAMLLIARRDGETILTSTSFTVRAIHRIPSSLPTPQSRLAQALLTARFERENGLGLFALSVVLEILRTADKAAPITLATLRTGDHYESEFTYSINGVAVRQVFSTINPAEFPAAKPSRTGHLTMQFDTAARASFFKAMEAVSTDETRIVLNGVALDSTVEHHAAIGTDARQLVCSNSLTLPAIGIVVVPALSIFRDKTLKNTTWSLTFFPPPKRKHNYEHVSRTIQKLGKQIRELEHESDPERDSIDEAQNIRMCSLLSRLGRAQNYRDAQNAYQLRIENGDTTYEFDAIEGNYPDYRGVIPGADDYNVTVPLDTAVRDQLAAILPKLPKNAKNRERIDLHIDGASVTIHNGKAVVPLPTRAVWKSKNAGIMRIAIDRTFLLRAARFGFNAMHLIDDISVVVFEEATSRYIAQPMPFDA